MKFGGPRFFRRSVLLVAAGILAVVLTACTGVGGGYLPPSAPAFNGRASLGFTFSCEDKGGLNPPTGQLRIELAYTEHGTYVPVGSPFSIHGIKRLSGSGRCCSGSFEITTSAASKIQAPERKLV